ncbi:MAG: hypothetical protein AB1696_07715 [Planctomycetota bacterium]
MPKKPDERFSTPKDTYSIWRKGVDAELDSEERKNLRECYSDNPIWDKRDEMLECLVNTIKANKFEYGDATISGNRADVVLKNEAGKTLTLGFLKEGDYWRLDSIPDLRPIYKKLLNPILFIPVFVLILLLALWRRRVVLKAIKEAESKSRK